MMTIQSIIQKNIRLREEQGVRRTLLAVCPNSVAVLAAGVKAAARYNSVMLFAATLNQVDLDGGYTGWTPGHFVRMLDSFAARYDCRGGLFPCLDHGGPWLKDRDTADHLTFDQTFRNVKQTIEACVHAGYALLHIDPTVDRTLPAGEAISVETVVNRSVELILFCEHVRRRIGGPVISYEVGTEEVHGGMVDLAQFGTFVTRLWCRMAEENLLNCWPAFFVAQVGTDLHTTRFDPLAAARIFEVLSPLGSLAKGHYSDWVENPGDYPWTGMGGANVGPEFTAEEYLALAGLENMERRLFKEGVVRIPSRFIAILTEAVVRSGRWRKWLLEGETGKEFDQLDPTRREWLAQTGSRYVWTDPQVLAAREALYQNVTLAVPDPVEYVVDRITRSIGKYIAAFQLEDSLDDYS